MLRDSINSCERGFPQGRKSHEQLSSRYGLEHFYYVRRRYLRVSGCKRVHVVGHDLHILDKEPLLGRRLCDDVPETGLNIAGQHISAVFSGPDDVVVNIVNNRPPVYQISHT